MLLDRNANIEASTNVSRHVIMACTALCIIIIVIIIIIIGFLIVNIILSIIILYSYSIQYKNIFYYVVVVKFCVMMMYIDSYSDNNLVYLWCHTISHNTLYNI